MAFCLRSWTGGQGGRSVLLHPSEGLRASVESLAGIDSTEFLASREAVSSAAGVSAQSPTKVSALATNCWAHHQFY